MGLKFNVQTEAAYEISRGWREYGVERPEMRRKKTKKEKNTRYSRQKGETIKNTDAQIKPEAEKEPTPGKQDVTAAEWGKQESRVRMRKQTQSIQGRGPDPCPPMPAACP